MNGVRRFGGAVALALVAVASVRAEDAKERLELRGGDRLEGRILCVSARHVIFDAAGGPRFVERSSVLAARTADGSTIDLAARETQATRDVTGLFLSLVNNEKVIVNRGESSFEPTALSSEKGISNALLRPGDELRTGPWGAAKVLLPKGTLLSANRDAVVQLAETGPTVVRGSARFKEGDVSVAIPEGRASGQGLDVGFDHTGGRTRITCYAGTCSVEGDGWRLELFKNHTVDVSNGQGEQSPYVAANASNSFPIDLKIGSKRMQVQPGQTVCLVVIHSDREAPAAPREAAPRETAPRETNPPPSSEGGIARIAKMSEKGTLWLTRSASQAWPITADKASTAVIRPGDRIATDDARVTLAFDRPQATIDMNVGTTLVAPSEDSFASSAFKLQQGQISARTASGSILLSTPAGEVTIDEGEAIVTASSSSTQVRSKEGRAVLRVGRDVIADVPPGIDLKGSTSEGRTKLEGDGKGASFVRIAKILNLQLPASKALECGRADDGTIWVALWNNARVELDGSTEATMEDQDGLLVATLRNGTKKTVEPGATLKLTRSTEPGPTSPRIDTGERPLVKVDPEPTPPAPPPARVEPAGRETRTLTNGAVVTLVNWGTLTEKPSAGGLVEVQGPATSPILLASSARVTLRRSKSGDVSVVTDDRRSITWVQGSQTPSFTYKLDHEGKISIDLADDRALTVEKGASFELELRANGLVHAELVQQTVYVDKGQHLAVDRSGYRTTTSDMAKAGGAK